MEEHFLLIFLAVAVFCSLILSTTVYLHSMHLIKKKVLHNSTTAGCLGEHTHTHAHPPEFVCSERGEGRPGLRAD